MIYTLTLNPAIDRTIIVDEISKVDVTRVQKTRRDAAGKGINVSKVIDSLGGTSVCLGFIAGENGRYIKNQLAQNNIKNVFVDVEGETRENIKVLQTNSSGMIELNEKGPIITKEDKEKLFNILDSLLVKNDVLAISGSIPQGLDVSIYKEIIERYKSKGVVIVLDASGDLFTVGIEGLPHIIKPNKYELEKYLNKPLVSDRDIALEAKKLIVKGIDKVIVSLGKEGAIYVDCENSYRVVVPSLEVKSTVGAGDSFVAGLCVGLSRFDDEQELIKYAASVGSASCLTEGTYPGTIEDIENIKEKILVQEII